MALEKISISGISDVYAVSAIKKEFKKAVNQPWKNSEPYPEYQKKITRWSGSIRYRKRKSYRFSSIWKINQRKRFI